MSKNIDTDKMGEIISNIETAIKSVKDAINNYSNKAPSLEGSSFVGTIETKLENIRSSYDQAINPTLNTMLQKIGEVRSEYDLRSTNIENS